MLRSIWLYITEACNLRCSYCFNPDSMFADPRTLTPEIFRKLFDSILLYRDACGSSSEMELVLFGGEPTLHPDVLQSVLDYSFEKTSGKIRYLLVTNGLLVDSFAERIRHWVERYRLGIQLSLDGDPAGRSDRVGESERSSYAMLIAKALDCLIEQPLPFNIRATLLPKYAGDYFSNLRYFVSILERAKASRPGIRIFPEYLRNTWHEEDYRLLEQEIARIVTFIRQYFLKNKLLLDEGFIQKACRTLYYQNTGAAPPEGSSFCGFSSGLWAVSPEGKAFACHRVYGEPEMCIGDLVQRDVDFRRLEAISSVLNARCYAQPHPDTGLADCGSCRLRFACSAVCPAESFKRADARMPVRCNPVLFRFQTIFTRAVEEHLWDLHAKNADFRAEVARITGLER